MAGKSPFTVSGFYNQVRAVVPFVVFAEDADEAVEIADAMFLANEVETTAYDDGMGEDPVEWEVEREE